MDNFGKTTKSIKLANKNKNIKDSKKKNNNNKEY